jgi:hypothetical protein
MHPPLRLWLALLAGACSSPVSLSPDGAPLVPPADGGPLPADAPADLTARLDAPANLWYLTWTTNVVFDASHSRTVISVRPDGNIYYEKDGTPADNTMTAAERDDFARLLNRAGVLDELHAPGPCGPAAADYTEHLAVGQPEGDVEKEITSCHQAAYEDLRTFLRALITAHFSWASGTCPAPNVWRYMSPGCGAAAHPVCGSALEDGCAATRCSCTGHDVIGCDFTSEPYAHAGPCRDGGL